MWNTSRQNNNILSLSFSSNCAVAYSQMIYFSFLHFYTTKFLIIMTALSTEDISKCANSIMNFAVCDHLEATKNIPRRKGQKCQKLKVS